MSDSADKRRTEPGQERCIWPNPGGRGRHFERRTDGSGKIDAHRIGALEGEGDRGRAPDPSGGASHDRSLATQTA